MFPTAIDTRVREQHWKIRRQFRARVEQARSTDELTVAIVQELQRLYRSGEHGHVLNIHGINPHQVCGEEVIRADAEGSHWFANLWLASFARELQAALGEQLVEVIDTLEITSVTRDMASESPAWLHIVVTYD